MRPHVGLVSMLVLSLIAADGATQPVPDRGPTFVHLHSPRQACLTIEPTPIGCTPLSEGYFMNETTFDKLDIEVRRLQDAEHRLRAENTSLRASATSWQPGWLTMLVIATSSVALTLYVEHKL